MQRVEQPHLAVCAALELFNLSDIHYCRTVADVYRLVVPAIRLEQFLCWFDQGKPVVFVTWAWLSEEATDGFVNRTRQLQPEDFQHTHEDDQLWIIDVVAPFGHGSKAVRYLTDHLSDQADYALFCRNNPDNSLNRVGRINARKVQGKYC